MTTQGILHIPIGRKDLGKLSIDPCHTVSKPDKPLFDRIQSINRNGFRLGIFDHFETGHSLFFFLSLLDRLKVLFVFLELVLTKLNDESSALIVSQGVQQQDPSFHDGGRHGGRQVGSVQAERREHFASLLGRGGFDGNRFRNSQIGNPKAANQSEAQMFLQIRHLLRQLNQGFDLVGVGLKVFEQQSCRIDQMGGRPVVGKGRLQTRQPQLLDGMNEHVEPFEGRNGPLQMLLGQVHALHIAGNFQNGRFTLRGFFLD